VPEVISPSKPSTLPQEPVPRNLTEALDTLDRASSGAILLKMRSGDEGVAGELHDSLGRWIRNNWELYDKGPLYLDLARLGLQYPDDMSGVILTSWWRRIHSRPLDVVDQVRAMQQMNRDLAVPPPVGVPPRE
jgi:hypothetical protein